MSNENVSYMEISSYYEKNRQADVVRSVGLNENNYWGVRYWIDGNPLGIEWYPTKLRSIPQILHYKFVTPLMAPSTPYHECHQGVYFWINAWYNIPISNKE